MRRAVVLVLLALLPACSSAVGPAASSGSTPASTSTTTPAPSPTPKPTPTPTPTAPPPVVVLDPGHNGGNAVHPEVVDAPVPDGAGGTKPCNTTGTATDAGYPEHAFTWDVALRSEERRVGKEWRSRGWPEH